MTKRASVFGSVELRSWRWALVTILIYLGSVTLGGCDGKSGQQGAAAPAAPAGGAPAAPPPPKVTVSKPLEREVIEWDEYTGRLQSPEIVNVQPQVSGKILEAPFKEGELVTKGSILYVIDDRPFKADVDLNVSAVARSKAEADQAQLHLKRMADARQSNAVSADDFETAKSAAEQADANLGAAKAALEVSRLNLEWTRVVAPISGRVGRKIVDVGNIVAGGSTPTLLTTVLAVDPMYCYVDVPERRFLRYQELASKAKAPSVQAAHVNCYIKMENEQAYTHQGYVDFTGNSIDVGTGTIQMRAVVSNPDGMLTSGQFARLRYPGSEKIKAILIPDIAVNTDQNERFLLVVGNENKVEMRPVELGAIFGTLRAVTKGVTPDDRVVVNGLQLARPGAPVTPVNKAISDRELDDPSAAKAPPATSPAKDDEASDEGKP